MRENIFEKYPVPKAIMMLALPTIFGMLITVIYNLVDAFFIGQTNDTFQVAAVSLVMPFFYVMMSVGGIFGIGGGTYISRLLGQKNVEKAKQVSVFCFYTCIIFSIVLILILLCFQNEILKLLGTSPDTHFFASQYYRVLAFGGIAITMQYCLGHLIRSEGATTNAMIGLLVGAVVNVILDPIFIITLSMGIKGAAIATVIGNVVSVLYFLFYLLKGKSVLSIAYKKFVVKKEIILSVIKIGIPASLNTLLLATAFIVLNNHAASYSDTVVSALGIAHRIIQLPILIIIGLGQGLQPFVAYNYANKNLKRMIEGSVFALVSGIVFGTIVFIGYLSFSNELIRMFLNQPDVIVLGSKFLKIYSSSLPLLIVLFVAMFSFQAFGRPVPAAIFSVFRQGIAFIPAIFIFNKMFGLYGVIWAQPFSDFVSITFAVIMYFIIYKRIKKEHTAILVLNKEPKCDKIIEGVGEQNV